MADVKWIKITTDIFDDEKILMIESMPSADSIIVIWLKLLTFAGKQNNDGVFLMSNRIAYTDEMLACIFRRDINLVRLALNTFKQFGMIEIIEKVITIPNWNKHQSLDAYEKKKERDRLYQAERRAKQRLLVGGNSLAEGGLPLEDWQKVLKEFDNQCAYCGSTDGLEQEHIVPVAKGGRYEIGNIVPACRHCNASKNDRDLIEWYSTTDAFNPDRLHHILTYMSSYGMSPVAPYKKSSDTSSDKSSDIVISEEDIEKEKEKESERDIKISTDLQSVVDLYHSICISYPKIRSLSDARKKTIKARLKSYSLDDFKTLFENAEASSFLKGTEGGWKASFDWLIKEANMLKVLEGNYTDKPKTYGYRYKEKTPGWMGFTMGDAELDAINHVLKDDPDFQAEQEQLRQELQASFGRNR